MKEEEKEEWVRRQCAKTAEADQIAEVKARQIPI